MNAPQGTAAWLAERAGCITASRFSDVMAKIKSGEAADRKNYRAQLVAERLTGQPMESFSNAAMQWGNDQEPFARAAYEHFRGVFVDQVGFVLHPEIKFAGASPDGLIGKDGLVEIKCPNTATHIEYLLANEPPAKYHLQMLWQMECTGRQWCDFVSFDPRMPEEHQLFVVRFERDQARIDEMKQEAVRFLSEIEQTIRKLNMRLDRPLDELAAQA